MPSDKQYTEEEKAIMKQLEKKPRRLQMYKVHRKTDENLDLLAAVDSVCILKFSKNSENLITPVQDKVIMKDLRCLQRNITGDDAFILSKGCIQFLVWRIADNQHYSLKQQTCMFTLNCCGIDVEGSSSDDFSGLVNQVQLFYKNSKPLNLFEREFVLFPVFIGTEVFITLVQHPIEALTERNESRTEKCQVIHIGTGDMKVYKATVGLKIVKLLELTAKITGMTEHFDFDERALEITTHTLPNVPDPDKPFLLLYFLNRVLTTSSIFPDWKRVVDEFNTNHEQLQRDLVCHRRRLCVEVMNAVTVHGSKAARMLVDQRARIAQYHEKKPVKNDSAAQIV